MLWSFEATVSRFLTASFALSLVLLHVGGALSALSALALFVSRAARCVKLRRPPELSHYY